MGSIPPARSVPPMPDSSQVGSTPSLQEATYWELRRAILTGHLPPGTRIHEERLATAYGVSRLPIRESLWRLEQEGLVQSNRRRGRYVAGISVTEISDLYLVRRHLEILAVEFAIDRADDAQLAQLAHSVHDHVPAEQHLSAQLDDVIRGSEEFHLALYRASNSEVLFGQLHNIESRIQRYRNLTLRAPMRAEAAHHEHEAICKALLARDKVKATGLVSKHIAAALETMQRQLDQATENNSHKTLDTFGQ